VHRAVLFDKFDTAKMHGLDTSNVSSRVVSKRDEPGGIWAYAAHLLLCAVIARDVAEAICRLRYVVNFRWTRSSNIRCDAFTANDVD